MCEFFSGVLKKNGEVLYLENSNSHSKIIEHYKLDTKDDTRRWLRFEVLQKDRDERNKDLSTWSIKIDEETTPDWYLRNKTMYDKKIMEVFKKVLFSKVYRFDVEIELKLLKEFNKMLTVHNNFSEEQVLEKKLVMALDVVRVVAVVAKTEEAKRLLSRFMEKEYEAATVRTIKGFMNNKFYKIKDEYVGKAQNARYSYEYIEWIIKCMKILAKDDCDHVDITIKKDTPCKFENKHFAFILAPRIDKNWEEESE